MTGGMRGSHIASPPPAGSPVPPFERYAFNGTVVDRWLAVVEAQPQAVAVGGPGQVVTFADLDSRSDAIAAAIAREPEARRCPADPILVLAGHDAAAIAAVLGIWKAGGAVVVLDLALPDARLAAIAAASSAVLCLAARDLAERARNIGVGTVLKLEATGSGIARGVRGHDGGARPVSPVIGPGTLAQIVFTSGSTGVPKGVRYLHRTLLHDAWVRNTMGWATPTDVIAQPLPLAFAAGFHETLGILLAGAQVLLYDPRTRGISEFTRWLDSSGATGLLATPTLLLAIASNLPPSQRFPASLHLVRSTGERFLRRDAHQILKRLPEHCELVGIFGSSETGLLSSYLVTAESPDDVEPLPVGWPTPDKDIRLLDDGRMIVRSAFTAAGYHPEPAESDGVFFQEADGTLSVLTSDLLHRRADGCLLWLGRRDHTVKVRGYRVEPAEVEAALLASPEIREAVVVGQEREHGGTRLVAYVAFHDGQDVRAASLRRSLRSYLPAYMVPESVVALSELPRNERGKLDRAALPPPPERPTESESPRDNWESVLCDLWADVLDLEDVARDDDFFELGGDSLAAEELLARLATEYGTQVESHVLVAAPTVAQFADQARREQDPTHPTLVPVKPGGSRPPLFCAAGGGGLGLGFLPLSKRLPQEQSVWGLQARGLEARWSIPDWSVRSIAARHVKALRSVQPQGPYHLAGHSFGGLVAFEMAHQLHAAGQEVALLVILDSFAPDPATMPADPPQSLVDRLHHVLGLAATGVIPNAGHRHYLRFWQQAKVLSRRYRGRSWPGRTLVVTAQDAGVPGRAHEWAAFLSGQWRLRALPGTHETLLREPYVATVAEAVYEALQEATSASGS